MLTAVTDTHENVININGFVQDTGGDSPVLHTAIDTCCNQEMESDITET